MPYQFIDHTADVAVELRARSLEELFAEALCAFTDTVTEVKRVRPAEEHLLEVEAGSLEELMVEWLGELVYRFDADGLLFSESGDLVVEEREAPDGGAGGAFRLTATARGEPFDQERHPVKVEVKGVTYHDLAVEEAAGGWRGRVVFDI